MVPVKAPPLVAIMIAGLIGMAGCASGHPQRSGLTSGRSSPSLATSGPGAARPSSRHSPVPGVLVPYGFAAMSFTFVSAREAFVLGTSPCSHAPCTSIARTFDRGVTWRTAAVLAVPAGRPGMSAAPAVWGIRFAMPALGFVFGTGLWETSDGGARWTRAPGPGGAILALAPLDGQVLALTARCSPQHGCAQPATLSRRPLGGGPWHPVARVRPGGFGDPSELIATRAGVAAMLDGSTALVSSDGGRSIARHQTPCTSSATFYATSIAVISARGWAVLCTGQGYTGHTSKRVFGSDDGGMKWASRGVPGSNGSFGTLAAATPGDLTLSTASAASWLYRSGDGGITWQTVRTEDDGGAGWADLGFTTILDGAVVHGPADSDGNSDHRPGQLLLSSDAGASWQVVRFRR